MKYYYTVHSHAYSRLNVPKHTLLFQHPHITDVPIISIFGFWQFWFAWENNFQSNGSQSFFFFLHFYMNRKHGVANIIIPYLRSPLELFQGEMAPWTCLVLWSSHWTFTFMLTQNWFKLFQPLCHVGSWACSSNDSWRGGIECTNYFIALVMWYKHS